MDDLAYGPEPQCRVILFLQIPGYVSGRRVLTASHALDRQWFARDGHTLRAMTEFAVSALDPTSSRDVVVLPAATRDFILKALAEASVALSRTHGLRATTHILVEEGIQLTLDNSFRINHCNHLLLMKLIRGMLSGAARDARNSDAPRSGAE